MQNNEGNNSSNVTTFSDYSNFMTMSATEYTSKYHDTNYCV